MKARLFLLGLTVFFGSHSILAAQEHNHQHHDALEKLGAVSFPISCVSSVQKPFERGVALLHSFEYDSAEAQFQEVSKADPQCAIAFWGEALSLYHPLWFRLRQSDIDRGWTLVQKAQAVGAKSQRERDYISSLAALYRDLASLVPGSATGSATSERREVLYARAMGKLSETYPQDREAAVFYALALLASSDDQTGQENTKKAIAILNQLFAQDPNHPGVAHYLIHSCDNPQFAPQGLAAARLYAGIAPSSPHALHMPSHIFARLGLWQDDILSNLAAIDAAEKQAAMHMHTVHHRIHSMDFLEYAYLQIGDDAKAKAIVGELAAIRRDDLDEQFREPFDTLRAAFPAVYALETRHWKDALALQPLADGDPASQSITYWARAVAAGHLHDAAAARDAVAHYDAAFEAVKKGPQSYRAHYMETKRDEAHAWLAFVEGKNDAALALLRPIAEKQDASGKGETELPAREMLADMLLEMNRSQDALVEYEKSLHTDPNRFNGLYGAAQAAESAHQPAAKAAAFYAQLLKNCEATANSDRPELARAKSFVAHEKVALSKLFPPRNTHAVYSGGGMKCQ